MGVNIGNKTLKDAYIGNKPIKKIYLGNKLLWQRLPYDAEIEYLESSGSGTQRINIPNVIPTDYDNTFETKITFLGYTTTTQWIFWFTAFINDNSNTYRIIRNSNTNNSVLVYNGTKGANGGSSISVAIGTTYDIKIYPTYALFNNTRVNLGTLRGNPNTGYLKLFNSNVKLRFYNFKYTKGDNVVLDMIPVRVGQVGYMYDKVSGQLFGNSGTGNFILGNDI